MLFFWVNFKITSRNYIIFQKKVKKNQNFEKISKIVISSNQKKQHFVNNHGEKSEANQEKSYSKEEAHSPQESNKEGAEEKA